MVKLFLKITRKIIKHIILLFFYPVIFIIFIISVFFVKLKSLFWKPHYVAFGPTPLINIYYWSKALNKVKIKNSTIVYSIFPGFENIKFDYDFSWTFNKIIQPDIFAPICHILIFLWTIFKFNIFIFNFTGGFLQHTFLKTIEFPLLKILNKKIILIPYGADYFDYSVSDPFDKYQKRERYVRDYPHMKYVKNFSRIKYFSKFADKIICSGKLVYFPKIDCYKQPLCLDINKFNPQYPLKNKNKKIVILHVPNHRFMKGTDIIINIMNKLTKKYSIEFRLFERINYKKAIEEYRKADIFIDQIVLGTYGQTAIEAMAFGKPVLCYLRKDIVSHMKQIADCPIVNTSPDTLEKNLVRLIKSPLTRHKTGKQSRKYVKKYHSLKHIGNFLKGIINSL